MTCNFCKQPIDDDSAVCPFCGRKVDETSSKPSERRCANCNTLLVEGQGFCPHCGLKSNLALTNNDDSNSSSDNAVNVFFDVLDRKKRTKRNILISLIVILLIVAGVVLIIAGVNSFGNGFAVDTIGEIEEVFLENNVNFEVVEYEPLTKVAGSENGDYYLVLCRDSSGYLYAIVNGNDRTVSKLTTNYKLIEVVIEEIFSRSADGNIEFLWFVGDCIEAYGLDFLNNEEYHENFLGKVTGADGFLPVNVARDVVKNYSLTLFSDVAKNLDVYVIFEEGNAVPKYYVEGYVREVFNWPIREEDYKSVIVNNSDLDMDLYIMSWGPPYVKKESWTVMDKSFNKVGTYTSLDEVKKRFGIIH